MKGTVQLREIPAVISDTSDTGEVRIGSMSPAFPAVRGSNASDTAKARLGSMSPAFPPVRSR